MVVLSEHSEASSSSSSTHGHKYDVFLSFRGVDTRNGFTAYLHKALMDANITTFLDDEEIETGEDLKPELEGAIRASRASVIVLSKNYANSTWCLDELVLILEQRMTSNHIIIIPIFYHVEPTHVRKQQSSFGEAMAKHRQTMEAEINEDKRSKSAQKIDWWTKALTEVADLKGKDVNGRKEMEFIEEIVKDIYHRLHISSRSPLPQLFGMDYSIKFVTSWLEDASSHTTSILTILGMGGIGKTSLAKYIYGLHSHEFDTSCFIQDISARCESFNGLLDIQKQLHGDVLKPSPIQVHDVSVYTLMIEKALACKKVFLVLDDIDSLEQLDSLLGSKGFHPGSKIIITTKDAWLTESCELFKTNVKLRHAKHLLQGLYDTESRKLFYFHAFMSNDPKAGYKEVSQKLVNYCEGHPIALKVLGKSLHNRDLAYWEGCIEGLKKENCSPIDSVLRMSFDSLPTKDNKDLFKHIACFFVGMNKDHAVTILKACGIETRTGITNLIDRCLLSIGWNNELTMHQLLQKMGRFIVQQESPDKPWKRSRLWCHEESFKVLKQKKGKGNLLGLALDMRMLEKQMLRASFELNTDGLSNMDKLMLLQLNYVQITGSYENFPQELRWLCMHGYPLRSIPSDIPMENLVALDMSYSNIVSFGICYSNPQRLQKRQKLTGSCLEDKRLLGSLKILRSLKILNLSFCEQLCSLGGFDELPALECLILANCTGLFEVCESIERCFELVHVDLSYCNKLEKLPRIISMLKKVKSLLLNGCNLGESRIEISDMNSAEMLKANNIGINTKASPSTVLNNIPSDSKFFAISLPISLVSLSLANTNLSTESFPMDFTYLSMLKLLCLDGNPIVSLPKCVRSLPRLEILSLHNCKMLMSVEHPPHTLTSLNLFSDSKKPLLQKVLFDPEMSPLEFSICRTIMAPSSFEFEGVVKIQPMEGVEEKLLHSLGWTYLDFPSKSRIVTHHPDRLKDESEIQMYYEFGIFSIVYGGEEMPNWITYRSTGPSMSFIIPSSANKLRGLNFCYVRAHGFVVDNYKFLYEPLMYMPMITISNITKKRTWIYEHHIYLVNVDGKCLVFVSHWMFGMNEMECGDHITITPSQESYGYDFTMECGVSLV